MTGSPNLSNDLFWSILRDELDDASVNGLVWQALGYRYQDPHWNTELVEEAWRVAYPEPPDFIALRPATVQLTRSIPPEYKQLLKTELGFTGYPISELIPRKTRRATIVSWLLSYRQLKARSSPE